MPGAPGDGSRCPTKFETLEREGRNDRGTNECISAKGAGRLPHTRFHHELGHVTRRHVVTDHVDGASAARPFACQLERVAGVEVPELGGIDPVRSRLFALEEEVIDGTGRGTFAAFGVGFPGSSVPAAFGVGGQIQGGDERFAGAHPMSLPGQAKTIRRRAYTLRCASSSTAEQRTLNPQVPGSNPGGRTT